MFALKIFSDLLNIQKGVSFFHPLIRFPSSVLATQAFCLVNMGF